MNWNEDLEVPQAIVKRLETLDLVEQYEAARQLHALMRSEGGSPARMGALARAYANLYQLTRAGWGIQPEVFASRSLLYAQRATVQSPQSKIASASKVYALTLTGLHGEAAIELKRAEALAGDEPEFIAPIRLYLKFDTDALAAFDGSPHAKALAAYFDFLVAAPGKASELIERKSEAAIAAGAFMPTVYDRLIPTGGVGERQGLLVRSDEAFAAALVAHLPTMADVRPAVRMAALALKPVDDPVMGRRPILDALAFPDPKDDGPLRRTALGRLIQDITFGQVTHGATMLVQQLGVSANEYLDAAIPIVRENPYVSILEALRSIPRSGGEAVLESLAKVDHLELRRNMLFVSTVIRKAGDDGPLRQRVWSRMYALSSGTAHDIEHLLANVGLTSDADTKFELAMANWLDEISPGNPAGLVMRIRLQPEKECADLEKLRPVASMHPGVAAAAGAWLITADRFDDAASFYQMAIDRSPDPFYYKEKAGAALLAGHEGYFVESLERCLEVKPDEGLAHGLIHERLAYYHALNKDLKTALRHAKEASGTYSAWGLQCEADIRERRGEWNAAEQLIRNSAERYNEHSTWLRWCLTTGEGDREAAYAYALQHEGAALARHDDLRSRTEVAAAHLMGGNDAAAEAHLKILYERSGSAWGAMHAALLAIGREDAAARDAALKAAVDQAANARVGGKLRPALVALAAAMRADIADPKAAPLSLEAVDAVAKIDWSSVENVYSLAGRYAELTNRAELGLQLYERCLTHGERHTTAVALAAARLRVAGRDPMPLVWSSRPTQAEVHPRVDLLPWNRDRPTTQAATRPTTGPAQ
jgi:hypothetical protein